MKFWRHIELILLLLAGYSGYSQISFNAQPAEGCDSLEVTFTFLNPPPAQPVTSVEWNFGNGDTATGNGPHIIMYHTTGVFTVSVLVNGDILLPVQLIRVFPTPDAGFWWSDSLELGSYTVGMIAPHQQVDSIQYTYEWTVEGVTAGSTPGIIYTFVQAGDYTAELIVTNEAGCADTFSDTVRVTDLLDCPNVFTPNEDGMNDFFMVSSNGITVYSLKVYSKSGILVYEAEAPLIIWDGRNLSGQELSSGTYFYVITPAGGSGQFEKTGFVELFR